MAEAGESFNIFVHVHDKTFNVSAGDGSQRVKWLAHVGIARWDEENNQGWKRLGVPTAVELNDTGYEIEMSDVINSVLKSNDHISVKTSLNPSETR